MRRGPAKCAVARAVWRAVPGAVRRGPTGSEGGGQAGPVLLVVLVTRAGGCRGCCQDTGTRVRARPVWCRSGRAGGLVSGGVGIIRESVLDLRPVPRYLARCRWRYRRQGGSTRVRVR